MANPFRAALGGSQAPQGDPSGGFNGMVQQLQQFAAGFRGDPQQELQKMLSSGQMNQQQYNQLRGIAQSIVQMLPPLTRLQSCAR